jgi:hypothetical protein
MSQLPRLQLAICYKTIFVVIKQGIEDSEVSMMYNSTAGAYLPVLPTVAYTHIALKSFGSFFPITVAKAKSDSFGNLIVWYSTCLHVSFYKHSQCVHTLSHRLTLTRRRLVMGC